MFEVKITTETRVSIYSFWMLWKKPFATLLKSDQRKLFIRFKHYIFCSLLRNFPCNSALGVPDFQHLKRPTKVTNTPTFSLQYVIR